MQSQSTKWIGIVLIVVTGLLNFHIPHFLIEPNQRSDASRLIELVYLVNLFGAIAAAIGIYGVCALSALLWLAQETVGLPGLPQQWSEPSRLVSLLIEIIFAVVAWRCRYQRDANRS